MKALIIGCGHMGNRYLNVIRNLTPNEVELITVDPQKQISCPPEYKTHHHYQHIDEIPALHQFDLAIDSRPNLNRLEMFSWLQERDIPKIVIEKPHASSIGESLSMLALANESSVQKVMVPFIRRFKKEISPASLSSNMKVGALKSIIYSSGAIGLGCNGIHFIDYATYLFEQSPISVLASLDTHSIPSPRGTQFQDHGGSIIVNYPNGQLVMSLQSESTAGVHCTLMYEHGQIHIQEHSFGEIRRFCRKEEDLTLPIYRVGLENEVREREDFSIDVGNLITNGLRDLLNDDDVPGLQEAHNALTVIGAAQLSHDEARMVTIEEMAERTELSFRFT